MEKCIYRDYSPKISILLLLCLWNCNVKAYGNVYVFFFKLKAKADSEKFPEKLPNKVVTTRCHKI